MTFVINVTLVRGVSLPEPPKPIIAATIEPFTRGPVPQSCADGVAGAFGPELLVSKQFPDASIAAPFLGCWADVMSVAPEVARGVGGRP